jgi:hypothetical protein
LDRKIETMVTKNIVEFLKSFSKEELKERGILRGGTNQLKGTSIDPLIKLMREQGVDCLEDLSSRWFLETEGIFANPGSTEHKRGNILDLANPGNVFNSTNIMLNPYYEASHVSTDAEAQLEQVEEITFRVERDLQAALRRNIEQMEPGMTIVDGGVERTVEGGRIDITAKDTNNALVVIELKAGIAMPESVAQILAYMTSLKKEGNRDVRGVLVASDFDSRVVLAAEAVPALQLKQYSYVFSFRDR